MAAPFWFFVLPGGIEPTSEVSETPIRSIELWELEVMRCPHRESNLDLGFRKPSFYPLNYED